MNKKEIKEKIKSLKKLYDEDSFDDASAESKSFVSKLFKEKKYNKKARIRKNERNRAFRLVFIGKGDKINFNCHNRSGTKLSIVQDKVL